MLRMYLITPWTGTCVQPVPRQNVARYQALAALGPSARCAAPSFSLHRGRPPCSEEATRKRHEGIFFGWTRWNKDFFHREEQGFVFAPFPSLSCFLVVFCLTECWTKTDFEKLIAGPVMKKKALDVVVVDDDDELWHFWDIFSWPTAHRQNHTMWRCGSLLHAVRCNISDRLCPSTVSWVKSL